MVSPRRTLPVTRLQKGRDRPAGTNWDQKRNARPILTDLPGVLALQSGGGGI